MSEQGLLNIHFRGVCAHFRGIVAGVPHRVVLPDASGILTGVAFIDGHGEPYILWPHIAFLWAGLASLPLFNVDRLIKDGHIFGGVRLEIVNAIGPLTYPEEHETGGFDLVPKLTDTSFFYRPSMDVVTGGRAICYFDIANGIVGSAAHGKAQHATVQMMTSGKPILQVTPMVGDPHATNVQACQIELDAEDLYVGNSGFECVAFANFDFLLNYLTAEGGIPQHVSADLPGLDSSLQALNNPLAIAETLSRTVTRFTQSSVDVQKIIENLGTTPACSDTRYP